MPPEAGAVISMFQILSCSFFPLLFFPAEEEESKHLK